MFNLEWIWKSETVFRHGFAGPEDFRVEKRTRHDASDAKFGRRYPYRYLVQRFGIRPSGGKTWCGTISAGPWPLPPPHLPEDLPRGYHPRLQYVQIHHSLLQINHFLRPPPVNRSPFPRTVLSHYNPCSGSTARVHKLVSKSRGIYFQRHAALYYGTTAHDPCQKEQNSKPTNAYARYFPDLK